MKARRCSGCTESLSVFKKQTFCKDCSFKIKNSHTETKSRCKACLKQSASIYKSNQQLHEEQETRNRRSSSTEIPITEPVQIHRKIHVFLDNQSPLGFSGLPDNLIKKYVENQEKNKDKHRDHHKNLIKILAINQTEELEDKPSSSKDLHIIRSNPELIYEILKQIAYGTSGSVLMIKHIQSEELYAMKRMSISSSREKDRILAEISILNSCDNTNIIKFHECYEYCKTYNLIYELMSFSLENILDKNIHLSENTISYILRETLRALNYLHNRSIIHRDVKSGNVLCNSRGEVKLADFGFAREVDRNNRRRSAVIGTPYYMAPEVITGSKYDFKIDVWSLGMLALEIAQGKVNMQENLTEIMYKTLSDPAPELIEPDKWSEHFRNFLGRCLQKRPVERADSEELLRHPFLKRNMSMDELISILN